MTSGITCRVTDQEEEMQGEGSKGFPGLPLGKGQVCSCHLRQPDSPTLQRGILRVQLFFLEISLHIT